MQTHHIALVDIIGLTYFTLLNVLLFTLKILILDIIFVIDKLVYTILVKFHQVAHSMFP